VNRFTIGRLARETGVSVETVRYYERRGLLTQPSRPNGKGYREYSARDLAIMQHIKLGKKLGLQLAEMRRLVGLLGSGENFCDAFRELLAERLAFVRKEQERLSSVEMGLREALAACELRSPHDDCPIQRSLNSALGASVPNDGRQTQEA
jgi:MerR family mercuric resistance operon transcriptional regulator